MGFTISLRLVMPTLKMLPTLAFAALLGLAACDNPTEPPPVVHSFSVTPAPVILDFIGDTTTLTVDARDASGERIAQPGVSWSSHNPDVASVSLSGRVTATNQGMTKLTVLVGGLAEIVDVTVRSVPASIRFSFHPGTVAVGASSEVVATVQDGSGDNPQGVYPTFTSSDPTVLQVAQTDQGNTATITGLSVGTATIRASVGEVFAELEITVVPGG